MFCPNDTNSMRQASVPSHYGQPIIIDQCGSCGGVWFDAFELYKVKQGKAAEIEEIDPDVLRALSHINQQTLFCPRDRTELFQFKDPQFPKGIILMRCPKCHGFWLNRGVFTQYQEARQKLMISREQTPEDVKLKEDVKRLLHTHLNGSDQDVLGKVGKFLSTPVGKNALFPSYSSARTPAAENTFDSILNILIVILRLFVFR
jgi:Zn-finger nucleic acid-binding protein